MGAVLTLKRWTATVSYRHDSGCADAVFGIEELFELQSIVEHGPNWNAIEKITIELARRTEPTTFTVEDEQRK